MTTSGRAVAEKARATDLMLLGQPSLLGADIPPAARATVTGGGETAAGSSQVTGSGRTSVRSTKIAGSGHTAAGSTQIITRLRAEVPLLGVLLVLQGADVPPSGSPMFTQGGRTAVRSARVAGSGRTAPQFTRGGTTAVGGNSSRYSPLCVKL